MKKNLDKQEKLVGALWEFADDLQHSEPDMAAASLNGKPEIKMNSKAIDKAIKTIMDNFEYEIIEIQ